MSVLFINFLSLIFLLLSLLLVILLFSPFKYRFYLVSKENLSASFSAKIIPLFSLKLAFKDYQLITILRILGIKINFKGEKVKTKSKEKERDTKEKGWPFPIKLVTKENLQHFLELFYDFYQIFRPQELWISGKVGFPEPHHTAWLLACLSSLPAKIQEAIDIEPIWDEEYLEAEVTVAGNILIYQVLLRAIKFLFSKKTRRIWRKLKRQKKLRQHAT